jgi:hypothetical protein
MRILDHARIEVKDLRPAQWIRKKPGSQVPESITDTNFVVGFLGSRRHRQPKTNEERDYCTDGTLADSHVVS